MPPRRREDSSNANPRKIDAAEDTAVRNRKHVGTPASTELYATEERGKTKRAKRAPAGLSNHASRRHEFEFDPRVQDTSGVGGEATPLRPKPRRLNSIAPNQSFPVAPPTVSVVPAPRLPVAVAGSPIMNPMRERAGRQSHRAHGAAVPSSANTLASPVLPRSANTLASPVLPRPANTLASPVRPRPAGPTSLTSECQTSPSDGAQLIVEALQGNASHGLPMDQVRQALSGLAALAGLLQQSQLNPSSLLSSLLPVSSTPSSAPPAALPTSSSCTPCRIPGIIQPAVLLNQSGVPSMEESPRKLADIVKAKGAASRDTALVDPVDCGYCQSIGHVFEHARLQLKDYYRSMVIELHQSESKTAWASWLLPHILGQFELTESSYNIVTQRTCSNRMKTWFKHYPVDALFSQSMSIIPIFMNGMLSVANAYRFDTGGSQDIETKKQHWIILFRLTRGILRYWMTLLSRSSMDRHMTRVGISGDSLA
eukprot:GHVH01005417.1.p1 GENE.GHVH01005417.1~~GHVH01005417.1.p1  ORF type:complete len:483 (+),score=51.39 GHVH01005417.1:58-1506(+)